MAHEDFVRDVIFEDAELVLTLMSEVPDDVCQSPVRVKRVQDARARQQQAPAGQDMSLVFFLDTLTKQQNPSIAGSISRAGKLRLSPSQRSKLSRTE